MSQKSKLTIDDVKIMVSKYGCELLSDNYMNMKQKLLIKCSCSNIYEATLDSFKNKNKTTCNTCSKERLSKLKTSDSEYVESYIKDKGCLLLSEYVTAKDKLKIRCRCGNEFLKSFNKFKGGQIKCFDCVGRNDWRFANIKKYIEVESNSDCILMSDKCSNRKEKINIKCPCGKLYTTDFHSFLNANKRKCNECSDEIKISKLKKGIDYLFNYVQANSDSSLLSKEYNNQFDNLKYKCACGNIYETSFIAFKNGKRKCDLCSPSSKLEYIAERFFINNNIEYISQYSFDNLISPKGRKLKFDFAIMRKDNIKFLLELDGEQHFKPSNGFGGIEKFKQTQLHDKLKNEYCKNNNIILHRITYKEIKYLENILSDIISKHDNPVPSLEGNFFEGATTISI